MLRAIVELYDNFVARCAPSVRSPLDHQLGYNRVSHITWVLYSLYGVTNNTVNQRLVRLTTI